MIIRFAKNITILFVKQYKDKILNRLYSDRNFTPEAALAVNVKAVVLTSKPNLYFYVNNVDEIAYYDWLEFKELVTKRIF